MHTEEALTTLSTILNEPPLNDVQKLVFHHAWEGQTYTEISANSGYEESYLRDVGAKLWQRLSQALGQKITKNNLHTVFEQYLIKGNKLSLEQPPRTSQQQLLITEFTNPLAGSNPQTASLTSGFLEFPGAPVPLNSPFYIDRPPIEELAYTEIGKPGSVIRIKAPEKMGKSSLLIRIVAHAARMGYQIVSLDFQEADEAVFTSIDRFLRWFCAKASRQLKLKPLLDEYWDEDIGSKVSCSMYFKGYLLEQIGSPLVLALNEVNLVFEHPNIARDFLPLLRFWHEQAKQVETFQKLRLVVVHSTEIYVPLNINQSPFNVGLPIKLPPLTLEQVQDLARRHGLDWNDRSEAKQLMAIVGGHPYLVRVALYHLVTPPPTAPSGLRPASLSYELRLGKGGKEGDLEKLLQEAPTQTGIFSDHLRSYLATLQKEPELMAALKQVVTAKDSVRLAPILAYKLDSMGLVKLDGDECTPSCELYRLYFAAPNLGGEE